VCTNYLYCSLFITRLSYNDRPQLLSKEILADLITQAYVSRLPEKFSPYISSCLLRGYTQRVCSLQLTRDYHILRNVCIGSFTYYTQHI